MLEQILSAYEVTRDCTEAVPFGTGLINNTWLVKNSHSHFILQRINHNIFKRPEDIEFNIKNIAAYFSKTYPDYLFVTTETTTKKQELVFLAGEGYFRLFPFVQGSHTIDVVHTTNQAYEAARQFGRFTKLLSDFPVNELKITLPDFHNLTLRYKQFETALKNGNEQRINQSEATIHFLKEHKQIADTYSHICSDKNFKQRVTHHDTKISNVLFDDNDKGLCVIDLDTVMPGYFISDVGDMLRTYLSPVSEEEKDFSKIEIRDDYFKAIAEGYLGEMNVELNNEEKNHFVYAGKFMIYMQALRFLTDYINDDVYYGAKYEEHNFMRAKNQLVLLERLIEKEDKLTKLII